MFRNCFTSDGTEGKEGKEEDKKEEGGKQREDKNVPSFLRARAVRRALLPAPPSTRGVTFAGCDVENWIQVWGGVYRRRGGRARIGGRNGETRVAREKLEWEERQKVGGRKSCRLLKEDEEG